MVVRAVTTPPRVSVPPRPHPVTDDKYPDAPAATPAPASGGFSFVTVDGGDAEVCGPDGVCA